MLYANEGTGFNMKILGIHFRLYVFSCPIKLLLPIKDSDSSFVVQSILDLVIFYFELESRIFNIVTGYLEV